MRNFVVLAVTMVIARYVEGAFFGMVVLRVLGLIGAAPLFWTTFVFVALAVLGGLAYRSAYEDADEDERAELKDMLLRY